MQLDFNVPDSSVTVAESTNAQIKRWLTLRPILVNCLGRMMRKDKCVHDVYAFCCSRCLMGANCAACFSRTEAKQGNEGWRNSVFAGILKN